MATATAPKPISFFAALMRRQTAHGRRGACKVTANGKHHYVTGHYRNGGEITICLCGHMQDGSYIGITWTFEVGEPCSLFSDGKHLHVSAWDVPMKDQCTAELCPCGHERTGTIWS